mgnify:CR=1 FL=1
MRMPASAFSVIMNASFLKIPRDVLSRVICPFDVNVRAWEKAIFRLDTHFGPEISLGLALNEQWPTRRIVLSKRALSGSTLATGWTPGTDGYRALLADFRLIAADSYPRRVVLSGFLWLQGGCDCGSLTFDDPGLFCGNERERVAEYGDMVEVENRHTAHNGARQHIGRVEPAAEADFNDRNVNVLFLEDVEAEHSEEMKVVNVRCALGDGGLHDIVHVPEISRKGGLGKNTTVDAHTLAHVNKVR